MKVDQGAAELHVDIFDGLVRRRRHASESPFLWRSTKQLWRARFSWAAVQRACQASLSDAHRCCDVDDG